MIACGTLLLWWDIKPYMPYEILILKLLLLKRNTKLTGFAFMFAIDWLYQWEETRGSNSFSKAYFSKNSRRALSECHIAVERLRDDLNITVMRAYTFDEMHVYRNSRQGKGGTMLGLYYPGNRKV